MQMVQTGHITTTIVSLLMFIVLFIGYAYDQNLEPNFRELVTYIDHSQ